MSKMSIPMQRNRVVLAIDPGYERAGIAVVSGTNAHQELLHSDCFRTSSKLPFSERLAQIGEEIGRLLTLYTPDALALERLYFNSNQKTAMGVAEVRGALLFLAAERSIPIFEYTPSEVKVAITGYGRSGKTEVAGMLERLIKLPLKKRLDDEYDAIAVGITCLASERLK
jgi:crossover junction endodeoxyribonuclease RuvC